MTQTGSRAIVAAERDEKYHAEFVPPPPPAPGKIVVRSPLDSKGHPVHPDLHLTPEQAGELYDVLGSALGDYMER
jgi:hypothetical protein